MSDNRDDSFTGYHIRKMEERLERIEDLLGYFGRLLLRVDRKLDAIGSGMTSAETTRLIADINADTDKINKAAEQTRAAADKLNQTGV